MKFIGLPTGSCIDPSEINEIAVLEECFSSVKNKYISPRVVIYTNYTSHIVYFDTLDEAKVYAAFLATLS